MPLEHTILAFVRLRPMTGYDLKRSFDQSISYFWTATQSHIYRALDGLLTRGWITVEVILQADRPNRKVYSITPAGAAELHRWLATPQPLEPLRLEWLIQVFFAHELSDEELVSIFTARAQSIREQLDVYRTDVPANIERNHSRVGIERARALWQTTVDYGTVVKTAELRWLEEQIERLGDLPPLTMPALRNAAVNSEAGPSGRVNGTGDTGDTNDRIERHKEAEL